MVLNPYSFHRINFAKPFDFVYEEAMTLEQLRIFLAVAERQHVTRAAEVLGLTQSAVSAAVSALEARHGVRFFDRVGRRIVLTETGEAFMAEARAVLDRAETAEMVLEDMAREPRGRLRIHASQTVASYWLPPRLVALREMHPGIELRLTVSNTRHVADAVQEGAADLGLVEGAVAHGDLHRQVVARRVEFLTVYQHAAYATQYQHWVDKVRAAGGMLHVSLDVDFLDPSIAPAVGTTVPGGATFREAHLVMELLHESGLVTSLDLVELNPFLDDRGMTARLMVDLVGSLMGKKVFDRPTRSK